ncbi:hypothetical protein IQ235_06245 [Oscillatoriales cyanobacterium LEGE 11467]|uniref:Uncharacterized protein n=1 Tax=Zarconia navalis LEGE 11467 TaxID=1828826 RepID=A0A928VUB9_9CYAN|nr:hypothetical protein [Zarconia navalis]MBE9040392.1 hypothetical protein [Zarconia navalis LEGE 11467]
MKFFKFFLVLGAIVFSIAGVSHRAWGNSHAIPVMESPVPFALEKLAFQDESSDCFLDSKIDDDRLLEIEFTQTCLNEKMELPELLDRTEKRINDNEQFPLKVRNTQYSLIDDGIKVKSEMSIDYPVIGLVTLALDQDIFINLTEGKIDLQAGETQLNVNVSSIPIENFSSLIDQVVDSQLVVYDDKTVSEFLAQTGLDLKLAEDIGISPEAVKFTVRAIESHVSAKIDKEELTIAIDFGEKSPSGEDAATR